MTIGEVTFGVIMVISALTLYDTRSIHELGKCHHRMTNCLIGRARSVLYTHRNVG